MRVPAGAGGCGVAVDEAGTAATGCAAPGGTPGAGPGTGAGVAPGRGAAACAATAGGGCAAGGTVGNGGADACCAGACGAGACGAVRRGCGRRGQKRRDLRRRRGLLHGRPQPVRDRRHRLGRRALVFGHVVPAGIRPGQDHQAKQHQRPGRHPALRHRRRKAQRGADAAAAALRAEPAGHLLPLQAQRGGVGAHEPQRVGGSWQLADPAGLDGFQIGKPYAQALGQVGQLPAQALPPGAQLAAQLCGRCKGCLALCCVRHASLARNDAARSTRSGPQRLEDASPARFSGQPRTLPAARTVRRRAAAPPWAGAAQNAGAYLPPRAQRTHSRHKFDTDIRVASDTVRIKAAGAFVDAGNICLRQGSALSSWS